LTKYNVIVQKDLDTVTNKIGVLSNLNTTDKTNLVNAVNENKTQLADKASKTSLSGITVNAKDYGVKGDGSTGDTPLLQQALDYVSSIKGKLKIPNGTYKVWGLNVDSDVQIEMDTYTLFDLTTAPTSQSVFNITGTIGNKILLSNDVLLYSMQLKVALGSETSFVSGDTIKITSNDFYDIDNRTAQGQGGQKKGELVKVESVTNDGTNGIINLLMPTVDNYTVSNGASIQKITPKRRVRIKGGRVLGQGALTHYGANVLYGENIKFEDFHIENTYTYGIYLKDCQHVTVDKCSFRDIPKSTVGYGIACYDACQDVTVTNSYFDHCKHAITTGGTGEGVSNRITFHNNNVLRAEADAIDNHATCRYMTITDNKMYYGKKLGINFESPAGMIKGNLIHYCQADGMQIRNYTVSTLSNYIIENNQIYHPVGAGVRVMKVGTTNSYGLNSSISNNVIVLQDQTVADTNNWHGIQLEGVKDFSVTGNVVVNADKGIYTDTNSSNNVIIGNNVRQNVVPVDIRGTNDISMNNVGASVATSTAKTISSDSITVATNDGLIKVDTEASAATDDLSTINGGTTGQFITLITTSVNRDVTVKNNVGNIRLAGSDFVLSSTLDVLRLMYNGSFWTEVSRADNGV
jgi:parallel beta-helix repeat protein